MSDARLGVKMNSITCGLRVKETIIGGRFVQLVTDTGTIEISVPKEHFPFLEHNEVVFASLAITKVSLKNIDPQDLEISH